MNKANKKGSIGLVCDTKGFVVKVLHDTVVGISSACVGQPFVSLVNQGSMQKAQNMLRQVQTSGVAYDWELSFQVDGQIVPLHVAASAFESNILIVGYLSHFEMATFYDETMLINNEQANALRSLIKDQVQRSLAEPDNSMLEEMSKLNNELTGMQRELAKKNAELEVINTQKNQLLGMAAHDLRNPLGIIKSYSELLLRELGPQVSDEHQEFLDIIRASSNFMLSMVDDLLNVSKIEAGKLELNLKSVDLLVAAEYIVKLNRVFAERKHIAIEVIRETDVPLMVVDLPKIEQVLNNLLSNAVKYSHPNTTVRVHITREGNDLVVAVEDEGQGIPAAELDQLFQAFQKTSVKSTAGESSTGLGLMIVRRIIEGHGGRAWVDSEVGVGSTFAFSLPIVESDVQNNETLVAPLSLTSLCILVAEDNAVNLRLVMRVLEKMGHRVLQAEDGQQALEKILEEDLDVVLMDIEMPVMDGLTAVQNLRQREVETGDHLPVIALTAHSDVGERQRSLDAGMDEYLTKPVNREALLGTIARVLKYRKGM